MRDIVSININTLISCFVKFPPSCSFFKFLFFCSSIFSVRAILKEQEGGRKKGDINDFQWQNKLFNAFALFCCIYSFIFCLLERGGLWCASQGCGCCGKLKISVSNLIIIRDQVNINLAVCIFMNLRLFNRQLRSQEGSFVNDVHQKMGFWTPHNFRRF